MFLLKSRKACMKRRLPSKYKLDKITALFPLNTHHSPTMHLVHGVFKVCSNNVTFKLHAHKKSKTKKCAV